MYVFQVNISQNPPTESSTVRPNCPISKEEDDNYCEETQL